MNHAWGSKEWFEYQFSDIENEKTEDRWGHQWRGSQKFRYDLYIRMLKTLLPAKKSIKVLDIGCGLGDLTKMVWSLDPKNDITGIDISENAINRISKMNEKEGLRDLKFRVGSLPSLKFKDHSFNLVLCLEVLYYLNEEDRKISLEEINRIIKPGGYLLLSGGLDGSGRYFVEDVIVRLISKDFNIEMVEYNYAKIYTSVEKRFLSVLNHLKTTKMTMKSQGALNASSVSGISSKKSSQFLIKSIRTVLSWKEPVELSFKLSKLLLGSHGKTQIIILAKNKKDAI
jgi:ubiquinone/menaquinone biosynthesis C-methylase UbiE